MANQTLKSINLSQYELILLPGFIQWNSKNLEEEFGIPIRKGPEFASDLPSILGNLDSINLSNELPANKLLGISGRSQYHEMVKTQIDRAKQNIDQNTFYINRGRSDILIGENLPPPIIAEIVNCPNKSDKSILKKVKHYIDSGANIIDIGCVANKPQPERVQQIITLIRANFDILLSIDSMDVKEINYAIEDDIDMILSLDIGNYKQFSDIPKDIPIVILPTNINKGYFPKDPEKRVQNLFNLTEKMQNLGFTKLIGDPLLETPISPGIVPSLTSYFLYKQKTEQTQYKQFKIPMFFGVSNVVELMDVDSVGINGLLATIAIELDIGVLFTVEHSIKLMGGVKELKECVKLSYISKNKKSPPINQGIQIFKAKGKTSQKIPEIDYKSKPIIIDRIDHSYEPDPKGYFKIYVNPYKNKIIVCFYSNSHELLQLIKGESAEALSKKVISLKLTDHLQHLNYLGRELSKAEFCLKTGKPYIQDS